MFEISEVDSGMYEVILEVISSTTDRFEPMIYSAVLDITNQIEKLIPEMPDQAMTEESTPEPELESEAEPIVKEPFIVVSQVYSYEFIMPPQDMLIRFKSPSIQALSEIVPTTGKWQLTMEVEESFKATVYLNQRERLIVVMANDLDLVGETTVVKLKLSGGLDDKTYSFSITISEEIVSQLPKVLVESEPSETEAESSQQDSNYLSSESFLEPTPAESDDPAGTEEANLVEG